MDVDTRGNQQFSPLLIKLEILNLKWGATDEAKRSSYRQLNRLLHPDKVAVWHSGSEPGPEDLSRSVQETRRVCQHKGPDAVRGGSAAGAAVESAAPDDDSVGRRTPRRGVSALRGG